MIHESYPWKQDLLRKKEAILKYSTADLLQNDEDDEAYTAIEMAIFYSAFIGLTSDKDRNEVLLRNMKHACGV